MGHFTGEDLNTLGIRAYQALLKGEKEKALTYARQALEACREYYGESHELTLRARENLQRMQMDQK